MQRRNVKLAHELYTFLENNINTFSYEPGLRVLMVCRSYMADGLFVVSLMISKI